ncbi:MAG: hypothetical protein LAO31_15750 [Acidobacteriia bacterium]|nr:hypothetical protein [Terriglobia bacterium]
MTAQKKTFLGVALFYVALLAFPAPTLSKEPKLDPQDLVARSLKAVGAPEKLAARKTCIAEGNGTVRVRTGGSGSMVGQTVFLSEGDKFRYDMKFESKDYPEELFAFDGQNAQVGYIRPGKRSKLGDFLYLYNGIIKEGLIGGVLSTAWPLTQLEQRGAKLQYRGLSKVEGKPAHEVRYQMRKGESNLNIFLYFEPETFRHVATIYRIIQPAPLAGRPDLSSSQTDNRLELLEVFEDFREEDGLTLPHRWTIHYTAEVGQSTFFGEWETGFEKITFNQPIDPKSFALQ